MLDSHKKWLTFDKVKDPSFAVAVAAGKESRKLATRSSLGSRSPLALSTAAGGIATQLTLSQTGRSGPIRASPGEVMPSMPLLSTRAMGFK